MSDNINLELKNIGPISNANLNISRINVVGGKNSTGKSTSSKVFYSLLKINTSQRLDRASEGLSQKIINILEDLQERRSIKDSIIVNHCKRLVNRFKHSDDIIDVIESFDNFKKFYSILSQCDNIEVSDLDNQFKKMDYNIKLILEDSSDNYTSFLLDILKSELNIDTSKKSDGFINLYGEFNNSEFTFPMDFESYECNIKGKFNVSGVHYLDSFSIFDRDDEGLFNTGHVAELSHNLKDNLEAQDVVDDLINEDIIEIQNKITHIIEGNLKHVGNNVVYVRDDESNISMKNTASGIKQIGIIQLLLANRKLKNGDYLIIDEPEVNLHPEWQFKLAEIIVLLAKELNITIYINTHSPLFIEAISAFSEYYDILDETNYYLTKECEDNRFVFNKINLDELYILYDDLGQPYEEIDIVRIRKSYKED